MLAQPVVRDTADQWAPTIPSAAPVAAPVLPGMRPASIVLSPTRVAGIDRGTRSTGPIAGDVQDPSTTVPMKPVRRALREGCEAPLSSLVGPEARRMVPGRCIS